MESSWHHKPKVVYKRSKLDGYIAKNGTLFDRWREYGKSIHGLPLDVKIMDAGTAFEKLEERC